VRMTVATRNGEELVQGTLLAQTSSRQFSHRHSDQSHAKAGERCSACRWTRITIVRDPDTEGDRCYAVVQEGFSLVPGETVVGTVERTSSPLWVIRCLHRRNREKEEYLSIVARNALLMACEYDKQIAAECEHLDIT
jgi:hypothetical protein